MSSQLTIDDSCIEQGSSFLIPIDSALSQQLPRLDMDCPNPAPWE